MSQPTHAEVLAVTEATDEWVARNFAREFDTPNVRRAIAAAEAGKVTWGQVVDLFTKSLRKSLDTVQAGQ